MQRRRSVPVRARVDTAPCTPVLRKRFKSFGLQTMAGWYPISRGVLARHGDVEKKLEP